MRHTKPMRGKNSLFFFIHFPKRRNICKEKKMIGTVQPCPNRTYTHINQLSKYYSHIIPYNIANQMWKRLYGEDSWVGFCIGSSACCIYNTHTYNTYLFNTVILQECNIFIFGDAWCDLAIPLFSIIPSLPYAHTTHTKYFYRTICNLKPPRV